MALFINWTTRVITIPKAYLTLVQSVPSIIYNLDINKFRKGVKLLEESVDGIVNDDTHTHNPEITISGTTLARVFNIINGYSIDFENDNEFDYYSVNLLGANSNIADVTIVNCVSIRSSNSAGLIVVSDTGVVDPLQLDRIESKVDDIYSLNLDMEQKLVVILGLSQNNYRISEPIYNVDNLLISSKVRIYGSPTDTQNDVNHIKEFVMDATYDSNCNLLSYTVVENV